MRFGHCSFCVDGVRITGKRWSRPGSESSGGVSGQVPSGVPGQVLPGQVSSGVPGQVLRGRERVLRAVCPSGDRTATVAEFGVPHSTPLLLIVSSAFVRLGVPWRTETLSPRSLLRGLFLYICRLTNNVFSITIPVSTISLSWMCFVFVIRS